MDNRLKEALDTVHAEASLKENTMEVLMRKFYRKPEKKHFFTARYAVICSVFLLLAGGVYQYYSTPVSYISIDINPSIELGINPADRIITVTPYNDDGEAAVNGLEIKNMKYDEALLRILDSEAMSAYLSSDAQINISVVSPSKEKNAEIQEKIEACTGSGYKNVSCHESSKGQIEDAHHAGLSFGKYRAFLELQSWKPEITIDEVKNMSMQQIQELIDLYSNDLSDNGEPAVHGHKEKKEYKKRKKECIKNNDNTDFNLN